MFHYPTHHPGSRRISDKGVKLIQAFEGCHKKQPDGRYKAYRDPVGVLTIGWGHTNHHGRPFDEDDIWTKEECDAALMDDLARFESAVSRLVTVNLTQYQFDALVSFTYNVGIANLTRSTLLKKLNAGDTKGAAQEFHRWNRAKGKVFPGLVRRRASEALLFQNIPDNNYNGIPDAWEIMPKKAGI